MRLDFLGLCIHIGREPAPRWADELEGRIVREMRHLMAKLEDKVAELNTVLTDIGTAVSGVSDDVAALEAKITDLQGQLSGDLSPEQETLMNDVLASATALKERVAALDALNPATPGDGGGEPEPS